MRIRPAEPEDAAALVELGAAVGREPGGWLITSGAWRSAADERRYLKAVRRYPHAAVFVAEDDDGSDRRPPLARARPASRERARRRPRADGRRAPTAGGGSAGRCSSRRSRWARAAGVRKLELHVFPHNEAAIALYEPFGFEREGYRKGHYRRGDGYVDAILMALEIDEEGARNAEVTTYAPGKPCWADVTSPDVDAAAAFYGGLFGWQADKAPQPEAGGYTMFSKDGKAVAAASPPTPGQEDVPPHWTVYLASDDVDATAGKVQEAGGQVLMEPFDVFDSGRMIVAADPTGAAFGVWQAGEHIGAQLRGEPGTMNWAEVQTKDTGAARSFYEQVFGYETEEAQMGGPDPYTVLNVDGEPAAGLIKIGEDWGEVPSNWSVVFEVDDTDAAVAKAQELGGRVLMEPMEIPEVGRFAVVADPAGAAFQVIK